MAATVMSSTAGFPITNSSSGWWQDASIVESTFPMMTTMSAEEGYAFSELSKMTLTVVISVVTLMGLLGNTMVILIVLCFSDMHTVINFFFANLALTDLTLLLLDAVPTATDTIGGNVSAKLGCNFTIYLQYVVAEVTSLTLAFMSYDRYRMIVNPLKSLSTRSSKQIYLIMVIIWIASFVTQIPAYFAPKISPEKGCAEFGQPWGEELFFSYALFSLYCVPLIVIIPCYTSIAINMAKASRSAATEANEDSKRRLAQRKRSIIRIFAVVIFYMLMWLPCHVVHMWMAFHPDITASTPLYIEQHTIANVLIFVNSAVNPYLYTLGGNSFRRHIKYIGHCLLCGRSRRNKPRDGISQIDIGSTMF